MAKQDKTQQFCENSSPEFGKNFEENLDENCNNLEQIETLPEICSNFDDSINNNNWKYVKMVQIPNFLEDSLKFKFIKIIEQNTEDTNFTRPVVKLKYDNCQNKNICNQIQIYSCTLSNGKSTANSKIE